MPFKIAYYLLTTVLAGTAVYIMAKMKRKTRKNYHSFPKGKGKLNAIKQLVKIKGDEKEYEKLFTMAGLHIDIYQYQFIRYAVCVMWLLILLVSSRFDILKFTNNNLLILLVCYAVTTPKKSFLGRKTPFIAIMDFLTAEQRNRKNIEIYRALSQLKNLTMSRKDNPPGALFIFEQLRKYTKTMRPTFNRMIALYQEDKKEEAEKYFTEAVGTKEAETLANLMMKLDTLSPAELNTQLTVYQENIKKERETNKLKSNERRSYAIYLIVVISVFIILMNFVVVVYTIDSVELLKYLR